MIRYLIDGYNFLNNSGIEATSTVSAGLSPLGAARQALLDFLIEHLTPEEARETVVIFDAHYQVRPLPAEFEYCGISVKFAVRYPDADSLLERLIDEHTSPRKLTVISSDHRVQRAARRRRAKFIDSEKWYRELLSRPARNRRTSSGPKEVSKPSHLPEMSPKDWVHVLGLNAESLQEEPLAIFHRELPKEIASDSGKDDPTDATGDQKSKASSPEPSLGEIPSELWPFVDFGLTREELETPIDALTENDLAKQQRPKSRRPRPH